MCSWSWSRLLQKKRAVIRRRRGFGQVRGKLPPKVGWWPSDQVILAMKLGVIAFSQIKTLSTLKMIRDHWTISVGHYHLFLKWKNSNTVCDSSKQSSSNILFFTEKQLFPDGRLQNKTGMATTKIVFGGSTIRWAVPWQPTEVPSPSLRRVRLACWLGARWYANNQPFTQFGIHKDTKGSLFFCGQMLLNKFVWWYANNRPLALSGYQWSNILLNSHQPIPIAC